MFSFHWMWHFANFDFNTSVIFFYYWNMFFLSCVLSVFYF